MEEVLYGLGCLVVAFLAYKIHRSWRNGIEEKLNISNYGHFINDWILIIASIIFALILFIKALIKE